MSPKAILNIPEVFLYREELLSASGIKEFELVHVNNKKNGNRIVTYAVNNKLNGVVTLNGAASLLFEKGDPIHVLSYVYLSEEEVESFCPRIVITDHENKLIESKLYKIG